MCVFCLLENLMALTRKQFVAVSMPKGKALCGDLTATSLLRVSGGKATSPAPPGWWSRKAGGRLTCRESRLFKSVASSPRTLCSGPHPDPPVLEDLETLLACHWKAMARLYGGRSESKSRGIRQRPASPGLPPLCRAPQQQNTWLEKQCCWGVRHLY